MLPPKKLLAGSALVHEDAYRLIARREGSRIWVPPPHDWCSK